MTEFVRKLERDEIHQKNERNEKIFTITIVIYFFVVTIQAQNTDPELRI